MMNERYAKHKDSIIKYEKFICELMRVNNNSHKYGQEIFFEINIDFGSLFSYKLNIPYHISQIINIDPLHDYSIPFEDKLLDFLGLSNENLKNHPYITWYDPTPIYFDKSSFQPITKSSTSSSFSFSHLFQLKQFRKYIIRPSTLAIQKVIKFDVNRDFINFYNLISSEEITNYCRNYNNQDKNKNDNDDIFKYVIPYINKFFDDCDNNENKYKLINNNNNIVILISSILKEFEKVKFLKISRFACLSLADWQLRISPGETWNWKSYLTTNNGISGYWHDMYIDRIYSGAPDEPNYMYFNHLIAQHWESVYPIVIKHLLIADICNIIYEYLSVNLNKNKNGVTAYFSTISSSSSKQKYRYFNKFDDDRSNYNDNTLLKLYSDLLSNMNYF